jgi:hypothetical protein
MRGQVIVSGHLLGERRRRRGRAGLVPLASPFLWLPAGRWRNAPCWPADQMQLAPRVARCSQYVIIRSHGVALFGPAVGGLL